MNNVLKLVIVASAHFTLCHLTAAVASEELLVSDGHTILQLTVGVGGGGGEGNRTVLVRAPTPVTAFDVHVARRQLFYAGGGAIFRTPLYDLGTTTPIAATGVVGGLAVDWVHHQVYWADLTHGSVEVAGLDGGGRRMVHSSRHLAGPLALDPQFGELFWLEKRLEGEGLRLMTSKFDGSRVRQVDHDNHIPVNSPLAVDADYKGVYFYQQGDGNASDSSCEQWEVNYSWPEGGVRLFARNESCPTSLGVAKGGFFYSNQRGLWAGAWESSVITVAYGDISETFRMLTPKFSLVERSLKSVVQIRVLSQSLWPDPFMGDGHRCQHDCVTTGLSQTACVCHFGYTLGPDLRSCRETGYIVDRSQTSIGRATLDGAEHTELYHNPRADILAMDLHPGRRLVYWIDIEAEAIYRAPIDRPNRRQAVVGDVSAYGVAVDWLHDHLYWTEYTRVVVSRLNGDYRIVLLDNVDAPNAIAVDPVNRYIFWTECGIQRRLRRGDLDGGHVITLSDDISCGTALTLDLDTRTVFWQTLSGALSSCGYSGADVVVHALQLPRAFTVLDQTVLWTSHHTLPPPETIDDSDQNWTFSFKHIHYSKEAIEIRVMKSPSRPVAPDPCEDTDCPGLCLLSSHQTVLRCLCSGTDKLATDCASHETTVNNDNPDSSRKYLTLVNTTAFSATLRCSGALLNHPMLRPYIHVDEVDSLVPRNSIRSTFVVRVSDKSRPFTIDSLNPATSYELKIRNRVTRAAHSMVVHTRPPPLAVHRLPEVTVPGIERPIAWRPQGVHYFSPNVWEKYIQREYMLILVSQNVYQLVNSPDVDEIIYHMLKNEIKHNFMILRHYKTKEDFDDDPTMHLGNLTWGDDYWVAMVQVTQYRQQYNLDIVYSDKFKLPDHSQTFIP